MNASQPPRPQPRDERTPEDLAWLAAHYAAAGALPPVSRQDLEQVVHLAALAAPRRAPERRRVAARIAELEHWRRGRDAHLVTFHDTAYPAALRHIHQPPPALFACGDVRVASRPAVAVVGSRAATASACAWTRELAHDLSRAGWVVVSGAARGIDAAAHRGALAAGGVTVAVLGCGVDVDYPVEHRELLAAIRGSGVVLSELFPGTPPRRWHFPRRNRILAGLVAGVVVVQAEVRSGARITARFALEENREVMAVPGDVRDPRSAGVHALLREGARLVEGAADVLEALGDPRRPAPGGEGRAATLETAVGNGQAGDLLSELEVPLDVDTLARRVEGDVAGLQARLAELEILGLVERDAAGRLRRRRPGC